MNRYISRSTQGFQLIELMCATFIVTAGLFGMMQMYIHGLRNIRAVNEYETAQIVLGNEMETLRALPFSKLLIGMEQPFRSYTPNMERMHLATGKVDIEALAGGPDRLLKVTVRLQWIGDHGRLIQKLLITLRTDMEASHE